MINNVLEEIKNLRIQRANAQEDVKHLNIKPTHFNMNIDTKAKRTVNNIENIYGSSENNREYINVGESNYKNNLFTGHQEDFSSTVRSASKAASNHSDYVNNFMGIPKGVKMLNTDNTIYYEKKLGKKTEFDFAIDNMTDGYNNDGKRLLSDFDKGFSHVLGEMKRKNTTTPKDLSTTKLNLKPTPPPIKRISPASVIVSPAFNTPLPEATETKFGKMAKKLVHRNIIKVIKDKIYHKDYDKERKANLYTATAAETEQTLTPKQRRKISKQDRELEATLAQSPTTIRKGSAKTPRTPVTKK